ncbi:flavin reductase [Nakamurella sp. YIM 132087]|uniref:Flavin reductase n=1 Tax=Nakamurella alba TaxID=2665158 RepID=A0A7K1FFY2_9ACTN|nr:flavin reductase family protein [Nakamurella alba]MTD13025.1 flavin reductase [Nakamurella alba]
MTPSTLIELHAPAGDPLVLRQVYGCFPSGVTALCAEIDGAEVGMAASSFTSVSVSPPLVSVCVQDTSTTWPKLRGGARIGVSVLAAGHDAACRSLSAKNGDRFAGVDRETTDTGAVLVRDAAAWMECSIESELPAGDHTIVLLRIHRMRANAAETPLVFHGSTFRSLA